MKRMSIFVLCLLVSNIFGSYVSAAVEEDLSGMETIYEENFENMDSSQLEKGFIFDGNNAGRTLTVEEYENMGKVMVARDRIYSGSGSLWSQISIAAENFIKRIGVSGKNMLVLEADVMFKENTAAANHNLLSEAPSANKSMIHGMRKSGNTLNTVFGIWSSRAEALAINVSDGTWYGVKVFYRFDAETDSVYIKTCAEEKGNESSKAESSWQKIVDYSFENGQISKFALLYTWIQRGVGTAGEFSEVYMDNLKVMLDADAVIERLDINTDGAATAISGSITGKTESSNIHIDVIFDDTGENEYNADISVDENGNFEVEFENKLKRNGKYTVTVTGGIQTYMQSYEISVYDEVPPVITLRGADVVLYEGETYEEYGADAEDDRDESYELLKNLKISGNENISAPGTYTVNYVTHDKAGNVSAAAVRRVEVLSGSRPPQTQQEKEITDKMNAGGSIRDVLTDETAAAADVTGLYKNITCVNILFDYLESMKPYGDFEEFKRKFSSRVSLVYDSELMLIYDYSNAENLESIKEIFEKSPLLDLENNESYKQLNSKNAVFTFASEQKFENPRELIEGVIEYIGIAFARQTAVEEINAADIGRMYQMLVKHADALEIDVNGDFAELENKDALYKLLIETDFKTADEIKKLFEENLEKLIYEQRLIKSINNAAYAEIKILVEANKNLFGISFDDISGAKLKTVLIALTEVEFTDAEHFKTVYYETLRKADSSGGGGSGGSGGGTGYTSVAVVPNTALQTDNAGSSEDEKGDVKTRIFDDVDDTYWAASYIEDFYNKKIIEGSGNNMFYPEAEITRAEFVKMAVTAFGFENQSASCAFDDIDENDWSYQYIAAASESGFINGVSETVFDAESYISRQDMAVILYRIAERLKIKLSGAGKEFEDGGEISDYARGAVQSLAGVNVINGFEGNEFKPFENAARAEAVKMIAVLLEQI